MSAYFENEKFTDTDFSQGSYESGEYENCTFSGCDFTHAKLAKSKFIDCSFSDCNLSMCDLDGTAIREVHFKDCKMLGLNFENCHEFGFAVGFEGCTLDHSSFFQRKMPRTKFINCRLLEVDFTGTDLTGAILTGSNLTSAKFENTILEKADLRTAINYSIDPQINYLQKAKFSLSGVVGLLDCFDLDIDLSS